MNDDSNARYGNLLTGSYGCVDRIVLNAYFSLGHSPGGFRVWWRRLHAGSEEQLDNAHLMGDGRSLLPAGAGVRRRDRDRS